MVEAGGIEPPSRDSAKTASTLMTRLLILARRDSGEGDLRKASPGKFHPQASGLQLSDYPTAVTPLSGLVGKAGAGSCVKQLVHSCPHLDFCARCLTGPPDNPGAQPYPQRARSSPFAPNVKEPQYIRRSRAVITIRKKRMIKDFAELPASSQFALHVTLYVSLADCVALVVFSLAASEAKENLRDAARVEIYFQGKECQSFFIDLGGQARDFTFMKQQFPGPLGVVIVLRGGVVVREVGVLEPDFTVLDAGVGILEADRPPAQALHLRAEKLDTGFELLQYFIVEIRLLVLNYRRHSISRTALYAFTMTIARNPAFR